MKQRIINSIVCLCFVLSLLTVTACTPTNESIVILYENDVHCAIDGYSKLAAMKNELTESFDHVGVVSVGDFAQGATIGAVSKGEYIINIMNKVGYDAIALGNHEFDFLLDQLLILNTMSNTKFTCCNFKKIETNESVFNPYTMVSYGKVDIAYIGITTPDTLTSSNPGQFKNEDGEFVYTFSNTQIYSVVQESIDAAEAAGADYIIALSHIGYTETEGIEDITEIIQNTDGLDVVLDAHAHVVIEEKVITDKKGDDVILTSTGTKFENIGKLTITKEGLHTELIETATYEKTDATIDAYLEEINESYAELGNRVIGHSSVTLDVYEGDVNIVRVSDTAIGNFTSDAIRIMTGADVSYVNGGGMRAPIKAGDITFNDIFSLFPYNNQVVTIKVTGQMLLDLMEMRTMEYPSPDGGFPSMSGVKFSLHTEAPSCVELDENGFFVRVNGAYRVHDVKILDGTTGQYVDLDLEKEYVLAGFNYHLLSLGGGLSMLEGAEVVDAEGTLDIEVLENYIVDYLGGTIGQEYAKPQGRITFVK